jgi:hypothetical protein
VAGGAGGICYDEYVESEELAAYMLMTNGRTDKFGGRVSAGKTVQTFLDKKYCIIQYVKNLFETNNINFSGSKPIIGRRITFNPEEIGPFGLEEFFYIL